MNKNDPLFRLLWWSFFTLIIDAYAIWSFRVGLLSGLQILMALIMTIGLIYMIARYKTGRSSAGKQESQNEKNQN